MRCQVSPDWWSYTLGLHAFALGVSPLLGSCIGGAAVPCTTAGTLQGFLGGQTHYLTPYNIQVYIYMFYCGSTIYILAVYADVRPLALGSTSRSYDFNLFQLSRRPLDAGNFLIRQGDPKPSFERAHTFSLSRANLEDLCLATHVPLYGAID